MPRLLFFFLKMCSFILETGECGGQGGRAEGDRESKSPYWLQSSTGPEPKSSLTLNGLSHPGALSSAFCMYGFDFSGHCRYTESYSKAFVTDFFYLAWCFQVHSYCSMRQCSIHFYSWIILFYLERPHLFLLFSLDGHLECSLFGYCAYACYTHFCKFFVFVLSFCFFYLTNPFF